MPMFVVDPAYLALCCLDVVNVLTAICGVVLALMLVLVLMLMRLQLAYTSSKGAVLAMTRELSVIHAR